MLVSQYILEKKDKILRGDFIDNDQYNDDTPDSRGN